MATTRVFTAESTGTSLNANFYMQNFYKANRNLVKASVRSDYHRSELSYEDSRALKRAAAKLSSFRYSDDENGENIVNTIEAFVETYNNTLDSSSSEDSDTYRQNRKLKALAQKYGEDLEDLGISIEKDGKLKVSKNILRSSSFEEVKKVFSEESDFIKEVRTISKRMHATSTDELYALMTGNGGRINIQL